MKPTCIMLSLIIGLFSCAINKNISRGTELSEATIREKLKPGKVYQMTFNSGRISDITIVSSDSMNVYGIENTIVGMGEETRPYSNSYANIHKNTIRIHEKRISIGLTVAATFFATVGGLVISTLVLSEWYDF